MQKESDAEDVKTSKLATKYLSVQADVLSGILLAKNIATHV